VWRFGTASMSWAAVGDTVRSIGAIAGDGLAAVLRPAMRTVPVYRDTRYSFAERAADLVSRMTLAEKVLQLRTTSAPAVARLGVQQYTYSNEGQHGINNLGADTDHGDVSGGVHATSFPTNFASSMSWDPGLLHAEATAISSEARGFLDKSLWGIGQNNLGPLPTDYGCLTYWAPTVNLDRDPRWGRTDEAFGEDPYLAARMAGAFVHGYQGQALDGTPLARYLKAAATAKHYALNNVEDDRTGVSSDVDDRTLREYYLAHFQDLVEHAHVAGLMTAYNAVNGTPAVANTYTVNQIAQRTFGSGSPATSRRTAAPWAPRTGASRPATTGRRPAGPPTTRATPRRGPTRRPGRGSPPRRVGRRTPCAPVPTSTALATRTT
jgi:Beta-glucosidase-related glycosidases